jgi:hypothetical protein
MAEETGSSMVVPNYNCKVETGIVRRKLVIARTFLVVRAKKAGGGGGGGWNGAWTCNCDGTHRNPPLGHGQCSPCDYATEHSHRHVLM